MYSISKKINILKQAHVAKDFFSNDEISRSQQQNSPVVTVVIITPLK
ncbi:Uncharacterised protein [Chryseobacterium carnipullorum]|uniref:Uncharacterized protein n=1 Tax=Chryseobacterium carnipullorum TaxID=1124835 RepID=A0A376DY55_CHRCU|nr:Uncharacterised protein [Chryseobacterium carnipullorum]